MNSYMNAGFNQYGNGFRNFNNNPIVNNASPNQISPTFQIVYGLLSCAQSVLSILGSIVDVTFFFKSLKEILYDFIINLLKKLLRLTYYLITLGFIRDSISLSNNAVKATINNSFGRIILKISSITTILLFFVALYLKFVKTSQIYDNKSDENDKDDKDKKINNSVEIDNSLSDKYCENDNIDKNNNTNVKISEERWVKNNNYK